MYWRVSEEKFWEMESYLWRENRLLLLIEPNKFYATILFWNHASNNFSCYNTFASHEVETGNKTG